MIVLFNSMQSSLSMVYDREMGSIKVLLLSPVPRPFLLGSKLIANTLVSAIQVYIFFAFALLLDVRLSALGYVYALPVIALLSLFLGSLGLLLANYIKQLENFRVMNFVVSRCSLSAPYTRFGKCVRPANGCIRFAPLTFSAAQITAICAL